MPWSKSDVEKHKKGLNDSEKARWVRIANSVRNKCLDEGSSEKVCDAKAIRQANSVVGNNDKGGNGRFNGVENEGNLGAASNYQRHKILANHYQVHTEIHEGKKHLVVPVVMMVEGVHSGSHGPLLHTITELGKFTGAWNGIPVCVDHPQLDGVSISANSPDVIESQTVGRVYNTFVEGRKLKAEAWLNEEKLKGVSPLAYDYIRDGKPLDVSVGVFTEDDFVAGTWEGETYTAVAKNHRPDHLALLPGGVGACSWADGCGVRVNKKGGSDSVGKKLMTLEELAKEGYSVLLANEVSHQDISFSIQSKLDRMDDDVKSHYLHAVFDEYFVYEKSNRSSGETELLKRPYSINSDDGSVEFTGEAVPVMRKVEYVTMSLKRTKPAKGGQTNMADEKKSCCPEKVQLLINSKHSGFEEKDRELLESFDQEMIDKLVAPVANLEAADNVEEEEDKKVDTNETGQTKEKVGTQVNADQAIQVLKESLKTPEEFIKILPKEMQDQMTSGLRLHKNKRSELVEEISAYSQVFTKEELEGKSMDELEKLAKMIPDRVDYSVYGANVGKGVNTNAGEVLLPPGVGMTEEKQG